MNEFTQILNEKSINQAYNNALRYLSFRQRTIKEVKDYLYKKKFDSHTIMAAINKLEEYNYLNDTDYCLLYINSKKKNNPRSRFALKYELSRKGVHESIVQDVLKDIDDYELAYLAIEYKMHLWKKFDKDVLKKKIMNYLKNRGFNYDVSISTFNKVIDV